MQLFFIVLSINDDFRRKFNLLFIYGSCKTQFDIFYCIVVNIRLWSLNKYQRFVL